MHSLRPISICFYILLFVLAPGLLRAQDSTRQIVAAVAYGARLSPSEMVSILNDQSSSHPLRKSFGYPSAAEHALPVSSGGADLVSGTAHPRSVAQRYIILTYSTTANANNALSGVLEVAGIAAAYINPPMVSSANITDVLVTDPAPADPLNTNFMWHAQLSNMPTASGAWSWGAGWQTVGVVDGGSPDLTHPDLLGSYNVLASWEYAVGNSFNGRRDIQYNSLNIRSLHTMMVSGLIAGRANNPTTPGQGIAGMCPGCRLSIQAAVPDAGALVKALEYTKRWGASVVNYSAGVGAAHVITDEPVPPSNTPCPAGEPQPGENLICVQLKSLRKRDVMFFAAAGNADSTRDADPVTTGKYGVQWPAREPLLSYAVGGTHVSSLSTGERWSESAWPSEPWDVIGGRCPSAGYNGTNLNTRKECGSNYGPELDFAAPARDVLVTLKQGAAYAAAWCDDGSFGLTTDGIGYCRGTSFATPIVAGGAALLRSLNPLVSGDDIAELMKATSKQSVAGSAVFSNSLGYGVPDFSAAARRLLGKSNGVQMSNRLTPAFFLQNDDEKDMLYTPSPQVAVSAVAGDIYNMACYRVSSGQPCTGVFFQPHEYALTTIETGRFIPDYEFPDTWNPMVRSLEVWPVPEWFSGMRATPSAYFHVFGGDLPMFGSAMVPLYRLALANNNCDTSNSSYATALTGPGSVNYFVDPSNSPVNFCGTPYQAMGYTVEGVEGYVMASCPSIFSGCNDFSDMSKPQPLYLRRSSSQGRFALLLGSQLSWSKYSTYTGTVDGGTGLLGYVFPHWDSDLDGLIDGQERILGTDRFNADSDCDGNRDGVEYPMFAIQSATQDPILGSTCGARITASVTWSSSISAQGNKAANYTVTVSNPSALPTATNVDVVFLYGGLNVGNSPALPSACRLGPRIGGHYLPQTHICNMGTVNSGVQKTLNFSWEVENRDDSERVSVMICADSFCMNYN